jgi:hypothetical protein
VRTEWLLCPKAHAEAKRSRLIVACDSNPNHACDGPRTAYLWKARGPGGTPFDSLVPCCVSCQSDDEYADSFRGDDEPCCCIHGSGDPGKAGTP